MQSGERRRQKILTAGPWKFIRAVSTVVLAVTHPSHRDAFPVSTLELAGSTCR